MKKIAFFILFLSFYKMEAQEQTYLSEVIQKWENAQKYTLQVASLMPDSDYTFSPVPDEMSFGHQMSHMGENMIWLSSSYLNKEKPAFKKIEYKNVTKKEIDDNLKIAFEYAHASLLSLKPENLEEKVNFFAGKMSKRQIINLMNDHLTHHRAQCLVYLRLKGIKPPEYIGW